MDRSRRDGLTRAQRAAVMRGRLLSVSRALSADELAEWLRVGPATLDAWQSGVPPSPEHHGLVVALDFVVALLSELLAPPSIRRWLFGLNGHLGDRRPIDVLRHHGLAEVLGAIEAQRTGVYV